MYYNDVPCPSRAMHSAHTPAIVNLPMNWNWKRKFHQFGIIFFDPAIEGLTKRHLKWQKIALCEMRKKEGFFGKIGTDEGYKLRWCSDTWHKLDSRFVIKLNSKTRIQQYKLLITWKYICTRFIAEWINWLHDGDDIVIESFQLFNLPKRVLSIVIKSLKRPVINK